MSKPVEWKILGGFGAAFVVVVVVSYLAFENSIDYVNDTKAVIQSHDFLAELEATLSTLERAETSQRGYIIAGDSSYLEPYNEALQHIERHTGTLKSQILGSNIHTARLRQLEGLMGKRLGILQERIHTRKYRGFEAAQKEILTGVGSAVMDSIRDVVAAMEDVERGRLAARIDAQQASLRDSVITFSIFIVIIFGLFAFVFVVIRRNLAEERRIEELKLEESRERYRHLFESNPLPMWVFDSETLAFLEVNEAATNQYGYRREEFLRMTIKDIRSQEDIPRLMVDLSEGKTGIDNSGVWQHRHKDGTLHDVEVTSHELVFEERKAKLVLANDITERRKAESRFRLVVESAPNAMVMVDQKGRIALVNSQTERFFGYSREELMGQSIEMLVPERYRTRHGGYRTGFMVEPHARPMGAGRDLFGLRKDGTEFPVEIGLTPIETTEGRVVLSSIVDVTDRKRAEAEIRKAENRIRTTLDHMLEGCQIIGFDWRYIYVNEVAARQGRSLPEDLLGHTMMEKYPGIENAEMFPPLRRCMEARVPHRMETEFTFPDKSSGWFDLSMEPVPEGVFILSEDITERKRLSVELEKHREHLEELVAERTIQLNAVNKELEAFSYSVSHDLRAPLRSIDGFSQALLEDEGGKLGDRGKEHLQRVRRASQHMAQLIDDLLNLARLTRADMRSEHVNLSETARAIVQELRRQNPDRKVQFQGMEGVTARGDSRLLRVALENLLGNAWKYTSKHPQASIEFGTTRNGHETIYFVRDDGAGFDMAYADKLFGAFQRLHGVREFPGTGIGLATVQRIIHRHGGRVWAESRVGEGATFYFTLSQEEL